MANLNTGKNYSFYFSNPEVTRFVKMCGIMELKCRIIEKMCGTMDQSSGTYKHSPVCNAKVLNHVIVITYLKCKF